MLAPQSSTDILLVQLMYVTFVPFWALKDVQKIRVKQSLLILSSHSTKADSPS